MSLFNRCKKSPDRRHLWLGTPFITDRPCADPYIKKWIDVDDTHQICAHCHKHRTVEADKLQGGGKA